MLLTFQAEANAALCPLRIFRGVSLWSGSLWSGSLYNDSLGNDPIRDCVGIIGPGDGGITSSTVKDVDWIGPPPYTYPVLELASAVLAESVVGFEPEDLS